MKSSTGYFVTFRNRHIDFGITIGLYPGLKLWIVLPTIEIRMGYQFKK